MISVVVIGKSVNDILEIVHDLRNLNYVQNHDFDFEYQAGQLDFYGNLISDKQTIFKFYNESLATWFSLKYL